MSDDDIFLIGDLQHEDPSSEIHLVTKPKPLRAIDPLQCSTHLPNKAVKRFSSPEDSKKAKLTSTTQLKIKIDTAVVSFDQETDGNFTKLYAYLFGSSRDGKLLYKSVPISRFSTLKSVKLDDEWPFTVQGETVLQFKHNIKVNYDVDKTIIVQNDGSTKVNDLISQVSELTRVLFKRAISNRAVLGNEELIVGDAVVDLI